MSFLAGWSYRKSVTISRASGSVTNYQMKILVGESSGSVGYDVCCDGLCASDFDDIRFTTSDGTTLLDYWIEKISGTTPNQLATIWIEFDSIGTSATTFYLYYGNEAATAVSNGDNTFILFDDFEDASVDTGKWSNGGSFTESGGTISKYAANTNTNYLFTSVNSFSSPLAIKASAKVGSDYGGPTVDQSWHIVIAFDAAWATSGFLSGHYSSSTDNYFGLLKFPGGTSNNTTGGITANIYNDYELLIADGSQKLLIDGVQKATLSITPLPTDPQKIFLDTSRTSANSDFTAYFDFVFIRNYRTTEPAFGAWGSEESRAGDFTDGLVIDDSIDAFSLTELISDSSGIGDTVDGYDTSGVFADVLEGNDIVDGVRESENLFYDNSGFQDEISANTEIESGLSDILSIHDLADAINWTDWITVNLDRSIVRYYCTITGSADGTTDIEIPISSFQARKQNGNATYLSVVIPGVSYADQIDARSNGDIVIDMAYLIDGTESQREEIVRAELEQINIQEGPNSRSISLIGHKDQTFIAKESRLYDPIYKARTDGALSYRFAVPDLWLNPGDTAQVDDDEFTVDTVIYMVSSGGQTTMEVQESA